MPFKIGQTVGGYEIIDLVDTLGLGVGYKVRNISENRVEILKILSREPREAHYGRQRFQREIKVHSRLIHPNIALFYGAKEIDGQLAIATEFVEGVSLKQRLREGALPLAESLDWVSQALAGIHHAHAHGVVHRCLSPEHLIMTRTGTVKVIGFGFAKTLTDPRLTLMGFVIGIPEYIAPEQVVDDVPVDGRADIYAMGSVLYELATGTLPFGFGGVFEIMQAHVNLTPVAPCETNSKLPPQLNDIILTALAKQPSERFQTANEFREALAAAKRNVEEAA